MDTLTVYAYRVTAMPQPNHSNQPTDLPEPSDGESAPASLKATLATSSGPVNRRTAGAAARRAPPARVAAPLANKLRGMKLRQQARLRLGEPLVALLQTQAARRTGPGAVRVLGAIGAAAGGVGGLIGALQASIGWLAGGAVLLGVGVVTVLKARASSNHVPLGAALDVLPPYDADALQKLDNVLEACAPELPQAAVDELLRLKACLQRMAAPLKQASVDENFTAEDRAYITEALRRYVPDSLQAYLQVPLAQRGSLLLDGGHTACVALQSQLALINAELARRETGLAKCAAQQLERQQRFLESKKSSAKH